LVVALAAAASLLAGCSKQSAQDSAVPKSVNLGTVELSPGQPSRHDLGDGIMCVLTAEPLGADRLQLVAVLEKSGQKAGSSRVAPIMADQPLQISLKGFKIDLTPHLK
jgi:hypothetical protein